MPDCLLPQHDGRVERRAMMRPRKVAYYASQQNRGAS
jgi:hypothetical protein